MTTCTPCTFPAVAQTVTLLDGSKRCSWCPSWRAECLAREIEARAILRTPDVESRRRQLQTAKAQHGDEYGNRLEAAVRDLWALSRNRTRTQGATP